MPENQLLKQLDNFIKAYYRNKTYNGLVVWLAIVVILFLGLILSEYISYFSSTIRAIFFYGFIIVTIFSFGLLVGRPFLQTLHILSRMSYEKAAQIIGSYFPEIDDKLLNAIQLNEQVATCQPEKTDLLLACIEQRTLEMKKFHFSLAINWQKTKRYLKYALIPILLLICLFVFNNQLITKPTQRIVQYGQYFEKPAPYSFIITNEKLQVFENENFTISVKIEGEEMPEEVFIKIDNADFQMQKMAINQYCYELKNVQKTTSFTIFSQEVYSQAYELQVLPQPILISFVMIMDYPTYTGKPNEKIENNSDIIVPQGTIITWDFYSRNTDAIIFKHQEKIDTLVSEKDKTSFKLRLMSNLEYNIININSFMQNKDSAVCFVHVVADQYPTIAITTMNDSVFADRYYFRGNIKDDYGFENLYFVYQIKDKDKVFEPQKINIDIEKQSVVQDFYYYFDAQTLNLSPGQQVEFYFEIWDNDAVNGSKVSKTNTEIFYLPSLDEIHQQTANSNKQVKSDIENLLKESEKILSQIDNLKKEMLNHNQPTWQEKKDMENLLKQLQNIRQQGEAIVQEQKKQEHINTQYNDLNQEIIDKQKELQRRFDDLFNDEMKSMMQEMQMLLNQNMDKNKMNQMIDNIKTNTEEINKSLDRQLELFKQLEIESKMDNIISQSLQMAEKEEQLAEKTSKDNQNNQLLEEQKDINQQFETLKSDLQQIEELNKNLEDAYHLDTINTLKKEIENKLNQATEQLKQKQNKKAAQTQKEAAEKMKELAQEIENQMIENEDENLGEDIQTIRQTLDNIVLASFSQEENLQKMNVTQVNQPAMRDIILQQYKLKDKLKLIEDSISAVARRQIMVEPFITKQIRTITQAQTDIMEMMNNSQEQMMMWYYGTNYGRQIAAKQQFIMTSLNDLALMLAESLKKMQDKQNQGSSSGCKKGNCNSDKQGKQASKSGTKAMKTMRQMQEQLNKQLEEMRKQMQQGGQQQSTQQGGQQSLSEQFARMAAQQEAIRKMMQDYQSQLKKDGKGYDGQIDRMLKEMEQTERELVNKILNQQTINRQQQIMTRLLQSEKAEMQREQDEQRQSTQAKDHPRSIPPAYIEQELKKHKETELYKTIPPTLNRFYRDKVNAYFYNFQNQK